MTLKSLAKGIVTTAGAAAIAGAATAGVMSASWSVAADAQRVQPVVFGVPLPLDPAADVPSADQLYGVLNGLAAPGVPFRTKGYQVEGGIGIIEGRAADGIMRDAAAKGLLPLSCQVSGIAPVAPGAVSADVTASGPGTEPRTENITFIDQGGWKLSRTSLMTLSQMTSG